VHACRVLAASGRRRYNNLLLPRRIDVHARAPRYGGGQGLRQRPLCAMFFILLMATKNIGACDLMLKKNMKWFHAMIVLVC
jgi:hypothetical protein